MRLGGSSVMYELCILKLEFLLWQRETTKWNVDFDATTPPLSETGWKDIWIPK